MCFGKEKRIRDVLELGESRMPFLILLFLNGLRGLQVLFAISGDDFRAGETRVVDLDIKILGLLVLLISHR